MIAQLISILYIFFIVLFTGGIISRIFKWNFSIFEEFFLGFALVNTVLTIISIAFPVNTFASLFYLVLIFIYISFNREWSKRYIKERKVKIANFVQKHPIFIVLITIWAFITFFKSLHSPYLHYDAGFYHVPFIRWICEYPAIPGLANLNPNFGFNNNIFTLMSATSLIPFLKGPIFPVNLSLSLIFGFWFFQLIQKALINKNHLLLIGLIISLYYLYDFGYGHISTTTPDIGVALIIIFILVNINISDKLRNSEILVFILSIYVITLKLSALPLVVFGILTLWHRKHFLKKRDYLNIFLIVLLITIPWFIKNIIITGYIVYPFPHFDFFDFNWKIPYKNVEQTKYFVENYAKTSGLIYDICEENWIKLWFINENKYYVVISVLSFYISLSVFFILNLKTNLKSKFQSITLFVILCSITFWFFTAPSFRFGVGYILSGLIVSLHSIEVNFKILEKLTKTSLVITIFVFLIFNWFHPWHFIKNVKQNFVAPSHVREPVPKQNKFSFYLIDNKLKCYIPKIGESCYYHQLPCTPTEIHNIHLRGHDLRQGFYVDYN